MNNTQSDTQIRIKKRNGKLQSVSFDKILYRIKSLSKDLSVDPSRLTQDVIGQLYDGMSSSQIDELSAKESHHRITIHPDYDTLAARIAISNHHKETIEEFSVVMLELYEDGQLSDTFYKSVLKNANVLDDAIDYDRDGYLTYHGFNTFLRSYGLRIRGKVMERPQHMWMRVALGIWGENIERVIETYNWMSTKHFIHASPTLFNCGSKIQQLSSCFLVAMKTEDYHPGDSIPKIFETLSDCARISKTAGGIGLSVSNVRATGSPITTTGRESNGIVPMLKMFEAMARYVDQGRKRKGAVAVYLEIWHADVMEFMDLRKNTGAEQLRARDLHLALWICDLFMRRVVEGGMWSLMSPMECPGLFEVHGKEFEELYLKYEKEGKYVKQIPAQDIYVAMITAQIETGEPYVLYKDHVNHKNNQSNLGTIRSSNLCSEILEYSDNEKTAVCNLSSIALASFVKPANEENPKPYFDFKDLSFVTRIVTRNLNRVIDINYYPTPETRNSNMSERPMGIGVQGLANAFISLRMPFDSPEAAQLNTQIFECIYYNALSESCDLAKKDGAYPTFKGSPLSQGKFQFDMWKEQGYKVSLSGMWDWEKLREDVVKYGVRNSLLVALMPTASTSQLLGFNEAFEPFTSNMYTRRTLAGSYKIVNKQLIFDLIERGLWSSQLKDKILLNDGSVQGIPEIPADLQALYKTSWDLPQSIIVDMAADRAPFVDQTQSMNIHIARPTVEQLSSLHYRTWKKGLKTGMYYLRTNPSHKAIQVTIDPRLATSSTTEKPTAQSEEPEKNRANPIDSLPKLPGTEKDDGVEWKCVKDTGCTSCGS